MAVAQVLTVAVTLGAGTVIASVLVLIGDVAGVPLILGLLPGTARQELRRWPFVAGVSLCLVGGTLTLTGGALVGTFPAWIWFTAPALPISIAVYLVFTSVASRVESVASLNGQAYLGAGLIVLVFCLAVPVAAVGEIFSTAVALVAELTVSDATVTPAPKLAVVVPCTQCVY